jgi:hypothetical protein
MITQLDAISSAIFDAVFWNCVDECSGITLRDLYG